MLGIDASNIRSGGGLKNLQELLMNAEPKRFGFKKVILWIGVFASAEIKAQDWLDVRAIKAFDEGIIKRNIWRYFKLKTSIHNDCDIVYTPGGLLLGGKIPELVVSQNMQPFDDAAVKAEKIGYAKLRLYLLKFSMTRAFRKADGIIFLNEYIRTHLSSLLGLSLTKSKAILMGSSKIFHLAPRKQLVIESYTSENPFKLLYVSTINTYKHQKELIAAFDRISNKYHVELHLVGGGYEPYYSQVVEQIKKSIASGSKIILHGKVRPDEVVKHYHSADCFIFSSSCENLPNILIEAMSSGLPIASSYIEPMPTVLADAGIYYNPKSVDSVEVAIVKRITDVALREKHAKLAFEMRSLFSWKKWSDETFKMLQNLVN